MATHSSMLSWRIPWTEEPGGLLSIRSLRVGHDKRLSMPAECLASSRSSKINCYTNEYVENWKGQFSFIN